MAVLIASALVYVAYQVYKNQQLTKLFKLQEEQAVWLLANEEDLKVPSGYAIEPFNPAMIGKMMMGR
jgi:hypothetical protein